MTRRCVGDIQVCLEHMCTPLVFLTRGFQCPLVRFEGTASYKNLGFRLHTSLEQAQMMLSLNSPCLWGWSLPTTVHPYHRPESQASSSFSETLFQLHVSGSTPGFQSTGQTQSPVSSIARLNAHCYFRLWGKKPSDQAS